MGRLRLAGTDAAGETKCGERPRRGNQNGSISPSAPSRLALADTLLELRQRSLYPGPSDWVFANPAGKPRAQGDILTRHLKPAAVRAGIGKIGWHTFRHSYSTMLRAAEVDIKVQQELLRHSTIQSTLNIYTQAVGERKRAANRLVGDALF